MTRQQWYYIAAGLFVAVGFSLFIFYSSGKQHQVTEENAMMIEKSMSEYFQHVELGLKNSNVNVTGNKNIKVNVSDNGNYYDISFPQKILSVVDIKDVNYLIKPYSGQIEVYGNGKYFFSSDDTFGLSVQKTKHDTQNFKVASQNVEALWSSDIDNFENYKLEMEGLAFNHTDQLVDIDFGVQHISAFGNVETQDDTWLSEDTFVIENLNVSADNEALFNAGRIEATAETSVHDKNILSFKSVFEEMTPENGNNNFNYDLFLQQLSSINFYTQKIKVENVTSEAADFQAEEFVLGIDIEKQGHESFDTEFEYRHKEAALAKNWPILNNAEMKLTFHNCSMQKFAKWFEATETIMSSNENRPVITNDKVIDNFLDFAKNVPINIEKISVGSPDSYQAQLRGSLIYKDSEALGLTGEFQADIFGLQKFLNDNPNLGLEAFAGIVAMYGDKDGENDAYHYEIKLHDNGLIVVNDREIHVLKELLN